MRASNSTFVKPHFESGHSRIPDRLFRSGCDRQEVSDYVAETTAAEGYRALKILLRTPLMAGSSFNLRLEKNQSAAAG